MEEQLTNLQREMTEQLANIQGQLQEKGREIAGLQNQVIELDMSLSTAQLNQR